MAMTASNMPQVMYPALRFTLWRYLTRLKSQIPLIYRQEKSDKQYEIVTSVGTFRTVPPFNGNLTEDDAHAGYTKTFVHQRYALSFRIDRDLLKFDQTGTIRRQIESLGDSAFISREQQAMLPFNNAFVSSANTNLPDGQPLVSSVHPTTASAQTFDNRISGGTPSFSYANLQAGIQGDAGLKLKDDRGKPVFSIPDTVLFSPDLLSRVTEAVRSTDRPDTANRAVSTLNKNILDRVEGEPGANLKMICSRFLTTNPLAWFLLDSDLVKKSFFWFDAEPIDLMKASDWSTLQVLGALTYMHSNGPVEWRGVIGSNAAT